jgi:hypothetical protein
VRLAALAFAFAFAVAFAARLRLPRAVAVAVALAARRDGNRLQSIRAERARRAFVERPIRQQTERERRQHERGLEGVPSHERGVSRARPEGRDGGVDFVEARERRCGRRAEAEAEDDEDDEEDGGGGGARRERMND